MNLDCYEPCPVSSNRLTKARKDTTCAACKEPAEIAELAFALPSDFTENTKEAASATDQA